MTFSLETPEWLQKQLLTRNKKLSTIQFMTEKEPEPVRSFDDRPHFEGIRPWFEAEIPDIPPELTSVYERYVDSLDPGEASMRMQIGHDFLGGEGEMVYHMKEGDPVGRNWAETLLEGTFVTLDPEEQARIRANPHLLVEITVGIFSTAIDKRNEVPGNNPGTDVF